MSDTQYEQYLKSHAYDHPLEEEEAKTRRELADLSKHSRKDRAQTKAGLHALRTSDDVLEWDDDPEDDSAVGRRKLRGNARTHKNRLKSMHKRS